MAIGYAVVGHYNAGFVCLSFGIALLAAYTSLNLGQQIFATQGWRQLLWLLGGALAMGTGIWATHFVAMLALEMPMVVTYDLLTTGFSLVYAVVAAGVALGLVSRAECSGLGLMAGGGVMGLAIAWMHYTGMAALEMPAQLSYQLPWVVIAVAISVGVATLALVATRWSRQHPEAGPRPGQLAILAMATAIGGLHYTAMVGTVFVPSAQGQGEPGMLPDLEARWLAIAVALGAGLILVITLVMLRLHQRLSDQRLQEAAVAQSEQRFRTLIREMGVGVLLLNARAEILMVNQAAQTFLHLPDLTGEPLVFGQGGRLCHEDGTPCTGSDLPVQRAIAQKAPVNDMVVGILGDAPEPVRWILLNVDPQLNVAGAIERVVCTCSDITIQKQAAAAVRAVANREKTVMRIVQRMRQTLDLETIFAATTQELQQAIGCDRVWIYRFQPDWSGIVVSETLTDPTAPSTQTTAADQHLIEREDCGVRQMRDGGLDDGYLLLEDTYLKETQAETYRQDRTYHRVNDIYAEGFDRCYLAFLEQWRVRAYVIVPIFSGSQLWGLLGIYAHHQPRTWTRHEVKMVLQVGAQLGTAVQQANLLWQTQQQAQALAEAKRTADAANQAKGDFLASMSHELRTPLNAILGFTQILYNDTSLESNHRDLIAIVNRSGNHLLGLINNVLSLAKIEANKITVDENCFNLDQTLRSVSTMLQLKAEVKGIRLKVLPLLLPYQLWADEGKLRQILINLISNAIKFTQQGSVTVRAQVKGAQAAPTQGNPKTHRLEITVQDTGVGMATEELACLFKPFEQTQSGRLSAEGTGLGLSLSYNFAQLMGGTITVTSTPGEGTTFVVDLPVGTAHAYSLGPADQRPSIERLAPQQPPQRILVVDDVAESRWLMRHWLEDAGFEVCEASNGHEAVDLWTRWQPHLICLDMRMPGLDGYGAARQIRQLPGGDATVIIAVTAGVFEEQQSDCTAAGCNNVVPKPLQREVLLEHIGHSLGLRYQYRALTEVAEQRPSGLQPLTRADFSGLSPDWLTQMYQSAQAADDRQVQQLIAALPAERQALAQPLTQLVNDFRLDVIIDLVAPDRGVSELTNSDQPSVPVVSVPL
jgi:signal transduction histidine kinase/NO-binding membrane sensor protein with MHYT domain/DNA-binding response OmpR family regulator